jgi:hypothetical protein
MKTIGLKTNEKEGIDFEKGCLQYEKLRDFASSSCMWKFQRRGLIFHEEWIASLHKEIINHSSTTSNLEGFDLW